MSNTFYAPGKQRAARGGDLFAAIARRYDLLNDLQSFGMHRLWKRRVVALANVKPGDAPSMSAAAPGTTHFALARCGAEVIGLDFSDQMLEVAQTRLQNPKFKAQNVKFLQGDAAQLPFPDNSFDAVTMGYGLRNLSSWETGLREMIRVARPGERIVVLDFGKPANALWRTLYFAHLKCSVPLIGLVFCGNPRAYAYILESLKHYPAQRAVAGKMRELRLANVQVVDFVGGAMAINFGQKP